MATASLPGYVNSTIASNNNPLPSFPGYVNSAISTAGTSASLPGYVGSSLEAYQWYHFAGGVRRPLRRILPAVPAPLSGANWSDENPPWALQPGESTMDNVPTGVPVVDVETYSTSSNLYTALMAVEAGVSGNVYVKLGTRTYTMDVAQTYSTGYYYGYANANRKVMGLIGDGVGATKVRVTSDFVNGNPAAKDMVLNATGLQTGGGPVQVIALYWSNTQTDVPFILSGIEFQGTLQTPYSTYSEGSQTHFRMNHAVPSPLAWNGMALWRALPGARIQFCKYAGFGFALNSAPPFESGALNTNYSDGLVIERVEFDGRIAAEIDPTQPRASGALMYNKGSEENLIDVWQHHTRRSGWATNTNRNDQGEAYLGRRVKAEFIADAPNDGWAGDNGGFNGSNVEEVIGTFTYEDVHLNVAIGDHINWAVPYSNQAGVTPIPDHPVIIVRGFTTDDTAYGGCLRIKVTRNPNSTGESRVWQTVNSLGIQGSGFFDIRNSAGVQMTGVRTSQWNASMDPSLYFVVNY